MKGRKYHLLINACIQLIPSVDDSPSSAVGFLNLPAELIEDIAGNLVDQHFDWDGAQAFFMGCASYPSAVRQLSRVCSFVHNAVERVLYHDINLRTNDVSPKWSDSSLSSFIRALAQRPELALLVRRATLNIDPDELGSYNLENTRSDLFQLFTKCTNIQTLFVKRLDGFSRILPVSNITTLAFSQILDEETLKPFPMIQNLFFYHTWGRFDFEDSSRTTLPPHLRNFRIFHRTTDPSYTLERAIALCGRSVRELRVDCAGQGNWPLPPPRQVPAYHSAIESLYVSDIPFLFIENHCTHMTTLRKLSIAGDIKLTPEFHTLSRLPSTLRTLVFIQNTTHIPFAINLFKFVSNILRSTLRVVSHIEITQSYRKTPMHLNLGYASSWREMCHDHCVLFYYRIENENRSTISIHCKFNCCSLYILAYLIVTSLLSSETI